MNQELLVKITRWILYGAIGTLAVAMFFVFFGERGDRDMMRKNMPWNMLGTEEGISSRAGDTAGKRMGSTSPGALSTPLAESPVMMNEIAPTDSSEAAVVPDSSTGAFEKRVIRNGSLSIRVEDAEWSADEIDRIATRLGGFTSSRNISDQVVYPDSPPMVRRIQLPMAQKSQPMVLQDAPVAERKSSGNVKSGTVVIKVPSVKFNEAISAIRGIASVVLNESSSASDVSAQFADLEARIKNKYAEEDAFTKILNTTSGKVSDVLEVTRELARVRGEIEQLETEKKYMESQTDMAEIFVSLTENAQVGAGSNAWQPWQTVKNAVNQLFAQFRSFVDGVIYFVVSVLPFFLLYLLGLYVAYRVGRRVYLKMRGQ